MVNRDGSREACPRRRRASLHSNTHDRLVPIHGLYRPSIRCSSEDQEAVEGGDASELVPDMFCVLAYGRDAPLTGGPAVPFAGRIVFGVVEDSKRRHARSKLDFRKAGAGSEEGR